MTARESPAATLLARLDGVQASGRGWRAKCPACGGKSRKVAIHEGDDGRALVKCFAGCSALEVVHALGLELADLFPERLRDDSPEGRRQLRRAAREAQWGAALDVLGFEAGIVLVAGRQLHEGEPLDPADLDRLQEATERIADARAVLRDHTPFRPMVTR